MFRRKARGTKLGAILLSKGYITTMQLKACLGGPEKLGQALLGAGIITPDQLEDALYAQRLLRGELTNYEIVRYQKRRHLKSVVRYSNEISRLAQTVVGRAKA